MICPKCNAQIPDDARECPKCKTEMKFDQPLDFSARNEKTIEHNQKQSGPSDNIKNVMFVAIIVLLLVITMMVYYSCANTGADDVANRVVPVVRWGVGV